MDPMGAVLLAFDLLLMGGLAYLLVVTRQNRGVQPAPEAFGATGAGTGRADELAQELQGQLNEIRDVAERIERKGVELDEHGRSLRVKEKKLDALLEKAVKARGGIDDGPEPATGSDVYSIASRMFRSGAGTEEISRKLGIPDGEAELLSTINRLRS